MPRASLPWFGLKRFNFQCDPEDLTDGHFNNALDENRLPNVTCLGIQLKLFTPIALEKYLVRFPNLEPLVLRHCSIDDRTLSNSMILPMNLCELVIQSCRNISRHLRVLLQGSAFPLKILVLNDFQLKMLDLLALAQASTEGRLPKLRYLDLSDNNLTDCKLKRLFEKSCTSEKLLSLHVRGIIDDSDFIGFTNRVPNDSLMYSLQELGIDSFRNLNVKWPYLGKLCLVYCTESGLQCISEAIDQGFLPALHTICAKKYTIYNASLLYILMERNINFHKAFPPFGQSLESIRCHCRIRT